MEFLLPVFVGLVIINSVVERLTIRKIANKIPLRIAVTGTRGKSSVTRLIVAGLSAAGYHALAKTTGSKAMIILPRGANIPIHRHGLPTILEQKKILKLALRERVDAIVVEVMSIRPEMYAVELQKILQPHIVVITNVRPDHVEALGETLEQAGLVFALGIPRVCRRVILLKDECPQTLLETLNKRGIPIRSVIKETYSELLTQYKRVDYYEWENNLSLALATCEEVGVSPEQALNGMLQAQPDFGALKIWNLPIYPSPWFAINAFAANDPASTKMIFERIKTWNQNINLPIIGLLNLRADRADRTLQWIRTLRTEAFDFDYAFVSGGGATATVRKLRDHVQYPIRALRFCRFLWPENIMKTVTSVSRKGGVIFGFGNVGGVGAVLIEYWEKIGKPIWL
ncbi:MAG: poly-gamma-glutamate synthase PgsB [Candidatus Methanomethylicaceae archaeon]